VAKRKATQPKAEVSEQILLPLGQPMSDPVRQNPDGMMGNGLFHYRSNRLEVLAASLAELLAKPADDPFTRELVVVQSLPLRRWLAMRLAETNQIFANVEFPFLATLVSRVLGLTREEQFSVDRLTWKIFSVLPDLLGQKNFSVVAEYLRDVDELKRFQLSARIAQLFDQYRIYRPEMIAEWENASVDHSANAPGSKRQLPISRRSTAPDRIGYQWQAELWKQVSQPSFSSEALRLAAAEGFESDGLNLPSRVVVFAPTALPPIYVDLLFRLSEVRELHLFQLQPSPHYRGHDLTDKQRARLKINDAENTRGNPLATSWGRLDVELTNTLLDAEERHGSAMQTGREDFVAPEPRDVLTTVQSDIFHSRVRGGSEAEDQDLAVTSVAANDASLTIHACHSAMREVEVLYDQLLELFDDLPGLQPRDILVMSPDIESYSPLIRAVFGYPEDTRMRIPFSISDRAARSDSLPIDTFFSLLDLAGSRFTAPQIFALLSSKSVRRKFRFNDEELALIREWIDDLAIRWGIDEEHQKTLGVPGSPSNTWIHGLDRLLLGYATPGENRDIFNGILPFDDVEGENADCLGRFVSAVRGLAALLKNLSGAKPLSKWADILLAAVEQFLEPGEPGELADIRFVRAAIGTLRDLEADMPVRAGLALTVEFGVVRAHLTNLLEATAQRGTFFTGGVTFCSLKPVRSVPARVICLLGLHDKVFPRRPQPPQFDLIAADRKSGDPSARLDDRYAFLEALMAAQDCLVITYIGRSAVHNKKLPPSVVVSELLDYANRALKFPDNELAEEFLVREHPLHGFSPRYFLKKDGKATDARLLSYSTANAEAARSIVTDAHDPERAFIGDPLQPAAEETLSRDLRQLTEFILNPPKYFLRRRLGMQTRQAGECLDDTEPFKVGGLDLYRLKEDRVVAAVESKPLPSLDAYRALGVFPAATMGDLDLNQLLEASKSFTELVNQQLNKLTPSEPVLIDIPLSKARLTGTVTHLYNEQIIRFRPTTLKPLDRLVAWIEHLAICTMLGAKAQDCVILSTDLKVTFKPVKNATEELDKLYSLFEEGQLQPQPFFPKTSWAYMADLFAGRPDRAVRSAYKSWHGDRYNDEGKEGEKKKPEMRRCFADQEPFRSDRFIEIARAIYEPMHAHEETEAL